jgi:mannose-1-phosphate guanylyltransferase/mannose-6-phosphate isomerase
MSDSKVKILIMCGGQGTRMWPISNMAHPKQFESILGKKSMFRETVERVLEVYAPEDIYIATSGSFSEQIKQQATEVPSENFIFEPAMRDNLGALGLATAIINKRHPDAVMALLWGADHLVKKVDVFLESLKKASEIATNNNVMVLIDALPTYPSVHNGWIEIGQEIEEVDGHKVYEFVRQVEKPDLAKAQEFYSSGKYLIHTGYLATKTSLLLEHYKNYAPDTFAIIERIIEAVDTPEYESVLATEYPKFEKLSVDYGLYEKLPPGAQWEMPDDFGWVDVGTWELLYHGLDKDENGNVIIGSASMIDVKNSLVISKGQGITGLIGLENMVVVQTDADILVVPLSKAPMVKDLYNQLQK